MFLLPKRIYSIRKYLQRHWGRAQSFSDNVGLTWQGGIAICVLVLLATTFGANIYYAVSQAAKNYELLEVERKKLASVAARSAELQLELEYYQSLDYKQRYAHDSLGLAKPGERLYVLETEPRVRYEAEPESPDPIKEDPQTWWTLVLGEMGQALRR